MLFHCTLIILQATHIHFVTSEHRRATPSSTLVELLQEELRRSNHSTEWIPTDLSRLDIGDTAAFKQVMSLAETEGDDAVLVCGTMYALGHVRKTMGLDTVYDDIQKL